MLNSVSNIALLIVYRNAVKMTVEKNHLVCFLVLYPANKRFIYFKNNYSARAFYKGCSVFQKRKRI